MSNHLEHAEYNPGEIHEKTFPVSKEEVSLIRADLAVDFPDDFLFLSDDYIESVASKPYSKDTSIRRPITYSTEKLKELLKWREQNAVGLPDLITMAKEENGDNPEKYTKAKALAVSLNYSSMYWHGLDKDGRPVLWIRTGRMPWFPDVEAQVNALICLADIGIKAMPKGVTDFVVIADSNSPPPPNPTFMLNLLSALVKGYPDRLNHLVSCPVGTVIQTVMKLLLPLMPQRLASKIVLIGNEEAKPKLGKILLNGEKDIPSFLGGSANHDQYYPDGGSFQNKVLKFDFDGMVNRLSAAVAEFEKNQM